MNKQQVSLNELKELPFIKVKDCPTVTGLSQGFVRGLISEGILPVVRNGRCIYVNKQMLLDTVNNMLQQQMDNQSGSDAL